MRRVVSWVVIVAVLALALPGEARGQESPELPEGSWAWSGVADVGMRIASRNLGTNTGNAAFLAPFAVRSSIDPAPVLGLGVQAEHRYRTVGVRAMLRTTFGAVMRGKPGICSLIEGDVCREHEGDARVSTLSVEGLFSTRREAAVRATFTLGVGLRHYRFEGLECETDEHLCTMVDDIKADQTQPMVTFGVGLNADLAGLPIHIKLQDMIGPFQAGRPGAEGELQNDVLITLGAEVPFD